MKQKAIIFGKGTYYEKKRKNIEKSYVIEAFLDNAIKPEMVEWKDGVKAYNPQNVNKLGEFKIILASNKWYQMWKQLMKLRIDESRIVFGITFSPFADAIEEIFNGENITICSKNRTLYVESAEEKWKISCEEELEKFVRNLFAKKNPHIKLISDMPLIPTSKRFGLERGTAIDRFYIEKFLNEHREYIKGSVMEIADNRYTKMFTENITESVVMHVNGWGEGVIQGNLATGEGIIENSIDCLICTQTIQFIYDVHNVVRNIYKLLKPNGRVLLTAAAIAQLSLYDYKNWGEYWRFTDQSMKKLFQEAFKAEQIEVYTYGNMKAAIAFMYGMCQEEIKQSDLDYQDGQFPMIVAVHARKV